MGDTLARIDATLDGLCACGCGAKLDPAGRSGWFATEGCQLRWSAERVGCKPQQHPLDLADFSVRFVVDTSAAERALAEAYGGVVAVFTQAAEALEALPRAMTESLRQATEALTAAEPEGDEPAPGTREHVLWMARRNRMPGPVPRRGRPPREIPPARSRR